MKRVNHSKPELIIKIRVSVLNGVTDNYKDDGHPFSHIQKMISTFHWRGYTHYNRYVGTTLGR